MVAQQSLDLLVKVRVLVRQRTLISKELGLKMEQREAKRDTNRAIAPKQAVPAPPFSQSSDYSLSECATASAARAPAPGTPNSPITCAKASC